MGPREQTADPWFTVVQAAEYLNLSVQTIRLKIRRGVIRATKPGRGWRVRKSELDRYEASTANVSVVEVSEVRKLGSGASRADEILASTM